MWIKFSSVIAYQSRMKLLDIQHPYCTHAGWVPSSSRCLCWHRLTVAKFDTLTHQQEGRFFFTTLTALCGLRHSAPCGLWVERIDPLRFLAGCHKRRLNQALSVLSLSLGFFWVCYCRVHQGHFFLYVICGALCSVSWLIWLRCQYHFKRLTGKTCLQNDL